MAAHAREPVTSGELERIETEDDRYPVPDPDGNPIAPSELDRAQQAMLDEMHAEPKDSQDHSTIHPDAARVDDQSRYDAARIEDAVEDLAQERAHVFGDPELGEDERLDRLAELDAGIRAYEANRDALVGPGTPSQAGAHAWWRNSGAEVVRAPQEPRAPLPWWSRQDGEAGRDRGDDSPPPGRDDPERQRDR